MGRYTKNTAYGQRIMRFGPDDFRISWTVDYYSPIIPPAVAESVHALH